MKAYLKKYSLFMFLGAALAIVGIHLLDWKYWFIMIPSAVLYVWSHS